MEAVGFDPIVASASMELFSLPITTKDDLRSNLSGFMSSSAARKKIQKKSTSGSSGTPFTFYRDRNYFELGSAGTMRNMALAGWKPGNALALLWGYEKNVERPIDRFKSLFSRTYYLNAFKQSPETMSEWIRLLSSRKIGFLYGYPSSLYMFGRYILERGIEMPLKAVFCTAEKYFTFERKVIEQAFHCKSYDFYGSSEVQNIAFECSKGNMHVASDFVLLESVPLTGGDCAGYPSTLIVTSFNNFCLPFIRYDLGDYGRLLEEHCDCGINTPLMQVAGGSKYDFLETPSGIVHGAVLERVFNKIPGAIRYQIVQHSVMSYTIKCECGQGIDRRSIAALVEESGRRVLAEIIGGPVDIAFEYADHLAPGPGGKFRFIYRDKEVLASPGWEA